MAYIGKQPEFTQYPSKFFDGDGSAMTVTLDYAPPNDAALLVFISGVRQDTSAYNCTGTSLTFTGSVPSGTNNVQVVHMGLTLDVGVPGDDTVTTVKIQDDAVTAAKIDANAVGNSEMADDAVGIAELSATGTASATTFLRGDNSWVVPTDTVYNDAGLQDDIALLGFKVASNGSLAKYNLVDQTVDDFQDDSGVNSGASTNAGRNSTNNYYSGLVSPTGGTITTYSTYTVHSFLSGTENFTSGGGTVDILAIGGGGSGSNGGGSAGGGGGAGGFVEFSGTIATGAHSVVIGPGGAGQTVGGQHGNAGTDTTFGSIITGYGGGGGGNYSANSPDSRGSSGGGGAYTTAYNAGANNTPAYGGSGTSYTNKGGNAWTSGIPTSGAGGGGGAGGAASNATNGNGTNGGSGKANSIRTGVSVTYAGGGGGSAHAHTPGSGGSGGGGAATASGPSGAGTVNTGSGGGGCASGTTGLGGSGIVVVRYTTGTLDIVGNNMTLVSNTTAAKSGLVPSKGDIVLTYTNGAGTTTLDTDLTAEISADGGSTWTAMTLGSEGSTGSHNIATAHDVTISSTITAPYNMAYRIKTLNQSVSKTTRIQAVSLGWT